MREKILIQLTKNCEQCGQLFAKKKERDIKSWLKARFCSPDCCYANRSQYGAWNKGKTNIYSRDTLEQMKSSLKGKIPWNKGLTKETDIRVLRNAQSNIGIPNSAEQIEASRQSMVKLWQQPWFRSKIMAARPAEARRFSMLYAQKICRETGKLSSPEKAEKNRQITLRLWQNPDYVSKVVKGQMKGKGIKPNKPEQKLISLMAEKGLPFKYVGDGQFILGGKCPDFINVNGKKQIIELFGTYWHDIFDVAERKEHFRQYGFDTLFIWEDELKDMTKVTKKLVKFSKSSHGVECGKQVA